MSENGTADVAFELPTKPRKPKTINARQLLIYSAPKAGKSTIFAGLENNLIIDTERGTDFLEALAVDAPDIQTINKILQALKKNNPYDYITIDTITALEDIVLPYAKHLYKNTPMGVNFTGDNVLHLPKGTGYLYLRQAFEKVVNGFRSLNVPLILSGHLREKYFEKKGKEVITHDVDLTGKLRSIVSAHSDAIGYLYRDGDQAILNFERRDESVINGSRAQHLSGAKIVISELQDDGSVKTFWDKVFLPEKE